MTPDQTLDSALPVILVGASPVALGPFFLSLPQAWPVIAADGGADTLAEYGRRPELVIGDMDLACRSTVGRAAASPGRSGRHRLRKCLARIRAPLIVGFGFLDGRLDHSLAVMNALASQKDPHAVMLCGTHDVVACFRSDARLPPRRVTGSRSGRLAARPFIDQAVSDGSWTGSKCRPAGSSARRTKPRRRVLR